MDLYKSAFKRIVDFVLPPRCPICGVVVGDNGKFCLSCWQQLDFTDEPWCASCGIPFAFERPQESKCANCLVDPPVHQGVRSVVAYDPNSAKIAMGLKYSAKLGFADIIANHLLKHLRNAPVNSIMVPVPLHRWRVWQRGFNQSELIASAIAKQSHVEVRDNLLLRRKATPPLRAMPKKQRGRIVRGAFSLAGGAKKELDGKTVFLIDDVYTTGSTAEACVRLLKTAGAGDVFILCWARVISEQHKIV